MFWEKTYSQSQNIENLLQREDVSVEELLDDEDILQECKLQTRRLMQFSMEKHEVQNNPVSTLFFSLTRPGVIKRLITLAITEPSENVSVAERFKYSNIACEILTSGLPSLDEKLVEDTEILQTLYSFLENEPPLNPLLAAFFSKTFSMLICKKNEQDWFLYQKMCLQLLEFIKSRGNFLDLMLKHFATPVIMDLLLQIIKEVQGGSLKKNLYEWLTEQKLVKRVISILGNPNEQEKHANVAEFLIDLIKYGRSMRQCDQKDSLELAFTGSDPLLQALEDDEAITLLLDAMLCEKPLESSIVAGTLIVLTLVDESIVEEPASDKALKKMIDKEKENYERVVLTVVNKIAPRMQEFHMLLLEPPKKYNFPICASKCFGLTRLQICRLFTVLLETGNEQVVDAICNTDYFKTLLTLFKEYSWNNFLHSEVEKCFAYVFKIADQFEDEKNDESSLSALQKHVILNCQIISRLVDCWLHNTETQSSENGRRLGYMGHLIQILKHVSLCLSNVDNVGALNDSIAVETEAASWKSLIDPENGELSRELALQSKLLADCDPKAIQNENIISDHDINIEVNLADGMEDPASPLNDSSMSKLYEYLENENVISCLLSHCDEMTANLERQLKVWGNNMNENTDRDMRLDSFGIEPMKTEANTLNVTVNPWQADPFSESATSDNELSSWADFSSNNFADFDSHFSLYKNDFGDSCEENPDNRESLDSQADGTAVVEKSDNNANFETLTNVDAIEKCSDLKSNTIISTDTENVENTCAGLLRVKNYDPEAVRLDESNGEDEESFKTKKGFDSLENEALPTSEMASKTELNSAVNGPSTMASQDEEEDLINSQRNANTEVMPADAAEILKNDIQSSSRSNALVLLESAYTSGKTDVLSIVSDDESKMIIADNGPL